MVQVIEDSSLQNISNHKKSKEEFKFQYHILSFLAFLVCFSPEGNI